MTCAIISCKLKRTKHGGQSFFSLPASSLSHSTKELNALTRLRRAAWIKAIKSPVINNDPTRVRVCSKHFISGKPSRLEDQLNPDWVPNQNMGYRNRKTACAIARYTRAMKRSAPPTTSRQDVITQQEHPLVGCCKRNALAKRNEGNSATGQVIHEVDVPASNGILQTLGEMTEGSSANGEVLHVEPAPDGNCVLQTLVEDSVLRLDVSILDQVIQSEEIVDFTVMDEESTSTCFVDSGAANASSGIINTVVIVSKVNGINPIIMCKVCLQLFPCDDDLLMHMETHVEAKYQCIYCSHCYATPDSLHFHYTQTHPSGEPCKCTVCSKSCPTPGTFLELDSAEESSECTKIKGGHGMCYKCQYCSRCYSHRCYLQRHLISNDSKVHLLKKPLQCQVCSKSYPSHKALYLHKRQVHKKSYQCKVCSKHFVEYSAFWKHKQRHKNYKCKRCSRRYSYFISLQYHMKTHHRVLNEGPYQCQRCSKGFKTVSLLQKHAGKCVPVKFECDAVSDSKDYVLVKEECEEVSDVMDAIVKEEYGVASDLLDYVKEEYEEENNLWGNAAVKEENDVVSDVLVGAITKKECGVASDSMD